MIAINVQYLQYFAIACFPKTRNKYRSQSIFAKHFHLGKGFQLRCLPSISLSRVSLSHILQAINWVPYRSLIKLNILRNAFRLEMCSECGKPRELSETAAKLKNMEQWRTYTVNWNGAFVWFTTGQNCMQCSPLQWKFNNFFSSLW